MNQSNYRRRERLRLPFYDYSQFGCYFVTICTKNRQCVFGEVKGGIMKLNAVGEIIKEILQSLTVYYPNSIITDYVIMPNHLHFIWFNQDNALLSDVVRKLKGNTTKQYHRFMQSQNRPYEPLW